LFSSCFVFCCEDGQIAKEAERLDAQVSIIFVWRFGRLTSLFALSLALSFPHCVIAFPHVLVHYSFFFFDHATFPARKK
jgi:hypothetical protein